MVPDGSLEEPDSVDCRYTDPQAHGSVPRRRVMGSVNVSSDAARVAGGPACATPAPVLENGDRLSRAEFERRYEARPDLKKAELIEGVVHMPSPTRSASQPARIGTIQAP